MIRIAWLFFLFWLPPPAHAAGSPISLAGAVDQLKALCLEKASHPFCPPPKAEEVVAGSDTNPPRGATAPAFGQPREIRVQQKVRLLAARLFPFADTQSPRSDEIAKYVAGLEDLSRQYEKMAQERVYERVYEFAYERRVIELVSLELHRLWQQAYAATLERWLVQTENDQGQGGLVGAAFSLGVMMDRYVAQVDSPVLKRIPAFHRLFAKLPWRASQLAIFSLPVLGAKVAVQDHLRAQAALLPPPPALILSFNREDGSSDRDENLQAKMEREEELLVRETMTNAAFVGIGLAGLASGGGVPASSVRTGMKWNRALRFGGYASLLLLVADVALARGLDAWKERDLGKNIVAALRAEAKSVPQSIESSLEFRMNLQRLENLLIGDGDVSHYFAVRRLFLLLNADGQSGLEPQDWRTFFSQAQTRGEVKLRDYFADFLCPQGDLRTESSDDHERRRQILLERLAGESWLVLKARDQALARTEGYLIEVRDRAGQSGGRAGQADIRVDQADRGVVHSASVAIPTSASKFEVLTGHLRSVQRERAEIAALMALVPHGEWQVTPASRVGPSVAIEKTIDVLRAHQQPASANHRWSEPIQVIDCSAQAL